MKSLKIVNSAEKDLKILIDLIKQNTDCDFSLTARLNNERLIIVCESLINNMSNPIKQDLEVLETILDNCENKFLDILHECLIRGTPIHTEDIQRLSEYINKILTIKKTMVRN
jgi:hypothetical protein